MLKRYWKNVVWIYNTSDNNLEIQKKFTLYLRVVSSIPIPMLETFFQLCFHLQNFPKIISLLLASVSVNRLEVA